jgi:hypothetical protein
MNVFYQTAPRKSARAVALIALIAALLYGSPVQAEANMELRGFGPPIALLASDTTTYGTLRELSITYRPHRNDPVQIWTRTGEPRTLTVKLIDHPGTRYIGAVPKKCSRVPAGENRNALTCTFNFRRAIVLPN